MPYLDHVMVKLPEHHYQARSPLAWDVQHTVASPRVGDVQWHVKRAGRGPRLVLLHGTGSSSHSWRGLVAHLAKDFECIAPDLPGHGDSGVTDQYPMTLQAITNSLAAMLARETEPPVAIIGHSAGAAIATQLGCTKRVIPQMLIALNGAFLPYGGMASRILSPLAKLAASSRLLVGHAARRAADPNAVKRMIVSTGSHLADRELAGYQTLFKSIPHIRATLRMMAAWRLESLQAQMPWLEVPLHLLVGELDTAVSPMQAERVVRKTPSASRHSVGALGHLMHEERPDLVADFVNKLLRHTVVAIPRGATPHAAKPDRSEHVDA